VTFFSKYLIRLSTFFINFAICRFSFRHWHQQNLNDVTDGLYFGKTGNLDCFWPALCNLTSVWASNIFIKSFT